MFVFNDAESFVVARSYKLGEADGGSDGGRTLPVLKKSALDCSDGKCDTPNQCETAEDCDANEYCTSLHVCKNLCERGKTYEGVVCANLPKTPSCAIETSGHDLVLRLYGDVVRTGLEMFDAGCSLSMRNVPCGRKMQLSRRQSFKR